jgi:hypothetical protein
LNLQFCNQILNYELPWNPMIVEQRIGRVHRIGQEREVLIHNYAALGTVEAHILRLLHSKIRLFELVVGELDLILDRMGDDEGSEFESLLGDLWLRAESDESFETEIERLGTALTEARQAAVAQERQANEVTAEDSAGRLVREFTTFPVPARLRLGYGTVHLTMAPGVEAARGQLGIHVSEILEMLGHAAVVEPAEFHPDYGPLYRITGITGGGKTVILHAQADRLPMTLVDIGMEPPVGTAA